MKEIVTQPPHAIVFLCDPYNPLADTPDISPTHVVTSNAHCIAICTLADVDGDTTIMIIERGDDYHSDRRIVFSGQLYAPQKTVVVQNSFLEPLLQCKVADIEVTVLIKVDDEKFPSIIEIYLM